MLPGSLDQDNIGYALCQHHTEYVLPAEPDLQVTVHLWPDSASLAASNEIVYEIAAQNLGGTAANSVRITDTWSFTIDTGPPDPPALQSPTNGTLTGTASLALTWQASPSADVVARDCSRHGRR